MKRSKTIGFFDRYKVAIIGSVIALIIGVYGRVILDKVFDNTIRLPRRVDEIEEKCDSIIYIFSRYREWHKKKHEKIEERLDNLEKVNN